MVCRSKQFAAVLAFGTIGIASIRYIRSAVLSSLSTASGQSLPISFFREPQSDSIVGLRRGKTVAGSEEGEVKLYFQDTDRLEVVHGRDWP